MKFVSNCTLLAASLSATYRTYNEYQPVETKRSLEHFLDDNGVLVTMCIRFPPWLECSRHENDSRLSASWVQANKTRGFRVFPSGLDPAVGLVLKPSTTSIRCLYPMDAGTNVRDNNGCGPEMFDARYGSQGYDHLSRSGKLKAREQVIDYKNTNFGSNRTWESIPCSEFVQPVFRNRTSRAIVGLLEKTNATKEENDQHYHWKYQGTEALMIDWLAHTMGHPVCNQSQPPPKPNFNDPSHMFVYESHYVFHSEDWPEVVKLFEDSVDVYPSVRNLNELVLDVAPSENDFFRQSVQAVFYITGRGIVADEIARVFAEREAKKWQKPVMYTHHYPSGESGEDEDGDLFHCTTHEQDIDGDEKVAAIGGKMLRKSSSS